ncbi:MAG: hypothetical protein JW779_00090 [Candidatus Thorarchaeota archaeon]|nr:hypothetical protein [Candidatus Thorarchaeota archaeon]
MVETAVLYGVDEVTFLSFLNRLPSIWERQKGFFEAGLTRLVAKAGHKDDLVYGVDVLSCGVQEPVIITILSEYQRDVSSAMVTIQASYAVNRVWGQAESTLKEVEVRIREYYERFEDILEDGTITFTEDFECPSCHARYSTRVLVNVEGKVQCQNCAKWFELEAKVQ